MPNVLEAPELSQERTAQREHSDSHQVAIPVSPPEPKRSSILAALKTLVSPHRRETRRQEWIECVYAGSRRTESAMDMLARKYPDIYIKATSG